jgi:hypothetical protein
MPIEIQITADLITSDALFILHSLAFAEQAGETLHVQEARETIGASVTLNFNDYIRFLEQGGLLAISEDFRLGLTSTGRSILTASKPDALVDPARSFFAGKIGESTFAYEFVPPAPGEFPPLATLFRRDNETPATLKPAAQSTTYLRGEVIGRGPHGRVIRARHNALHFEVALKEVRAPETGGRLLPETDFISRLKKELAAQARVHHPAIVAIHDLDLSGPPTIVSELCTGGNLRERVMNPTPPSTQSILVSFMQLLDALAMAEAEGLFHGNLKPENVLFDRYGNAKLADFGMRRLGTEATGDSIQNDIRALGMLLYVALTRKPHGPSAPFASKLVQGLPTAVDWVLDRMTTDVPKERYASAAAAQEAYFKAIANPALGEPGRPAVLTATIDSDSLPH